MAKKKIRDEKVTEAIRLISLNADSRQYFYKKADETRLKWLWNNDFFAVLKKKAENPSRYSYKTPELRYLARMAEINPELVTNIILDTSVSAETFNPEVIDQFIHICSSLPGEQLARLTAKINTENWPALMKTYNQFPMDYGKMFESLEKTRSYLELLELASVVLGLRDDLEYEEEQNYTGDNPFNITNLSYSKVFHYLSIIDESYIEEAINLSLSTLQKLTQNTEKLNETVSVFEKKDRYPLYQADIFAIGLRSEYHDSGRDDVQEVVALLTNLTERVLTQMCKEKAIVIFEKYFAPMPDSWLMWRIRLVVLSLCPKELMPHFKEALFRIFSEDHYTELIRGTEYKKALKKAFPLMGKDDQTEFVAMAKELFSHASEEDERPSKIQDGSFIFSVVGDYLSEDKISELVDTGFELNPEYVPIPSIGMSEAGIVKPKGPVTEEEFRSIPVITIVQNLKDIWSPAELIKQDVDRDFLKPLNAEGVGSLIKEDVKLRINEYLEYASEFLNLENMDLHYLYSLLSGLAEAINEILEPLENNDWEVLIQFCLQIVEYSKEQPAEPKEYERRVHGAWLGGWNAVHAEITNLLKRAVGASGKKLGFEWTLHRQDILSIIEFFFEYPDPIPGDEEISSAKMTESVGGQQPQVSDPYTIAINSIRGKAFELFASAVTQDTEKDNESDSVELSTDIKQLYEYLLSKEETRAIMFMLGRYLPLFFFRDKVWVKSILPLIFPSDNNKKYLYLAAWEGFLTNNLYVELFNEVEVQKLYKRAVVLIAKDYPNQKHFKNPDEGVSQHFALAYMVADFVFGNDLFDYFWADGGIDQHIAFVDMLGRSFVTSQNPKVFDFFKENVNAGRKLKDMWDWLLAADIDTRVFDGIGFWIDLDKGIFQANELASYLAKSLGKTDGYLQWDRGLQENIIAMAKGSPVDALEIARLYLLEGGVRKGINSRLFIIDKNWIEAFQILYSQPSTKAQTLALINDLIKEGGSLFWPLKGVIQGS